ncbi:UNVERIFIED_CONTAM: hypothetical protein K2H54_049490 [Gekko kuhli]
MSKEEEESVPTKTEMTATTLVTETTIPCILHPIGIQPARGEDVPGLDAAESLSEFPADTPWADDFHPKSMEETQSERLRDVAKNNAIHLNYLRMVNSRLVLDQDGVGTWIGESNCPSALRT